MVESDLFVLALSRVPRLGTTAMRQLLASFGTARAAWEASVDDLRQTVPRLADAIDVTRRQTDPERLMGRVQQAGCSLLVHGGAGYPPQLLDVAAAPLVLFVRGNVGGLTHGAGVAVVGTRRASVYALRVTDMLVDGLAGAGVCVISGMARGVDETAHRRALQAKAPTVAVLGCGPDVCYPPESRDLKQAIERGGAVVSQFLPGEPPLPTHFPARNRIISGLSRAVVVVEAGIKSGAMITAGFALDQQRPLFAVPGSVLSETSAGCNRLLSEGTAVLVRGADDVLHELGLRSVQKPPPAPLDNDEARRLFDVLDGHSGFDGDGGGWLEVEEIARLSGMPSNAAVRTLMRMELEGWVLRAPGNRYRSRRKR